MNKLVKLLLLGLFSAFCTSAAFAQNDYANFGEEITPDGAIECTQVAQKLAGVDSVNTKVRGIIGSVCQMKGCWMNLSDVADDTINIFVQFKDYGFFVPKDAAGKEAILEGVVRLTTTSVDDLRHFAEDAGKSAEEIAAITEPKVEIKFMASGVLIRN